MDAEEITAKRTAICSALASKTLANPDSKILAVIGAGVQAESHIQALSQLFNFSEVSLNHRQTYHNQNNPTDYFNKSFTFNFGKIAILGQNLSEKQPTLSSRFECGTEQNLAQKSSLGSCMM